MKHRPCLAERQLRSTRKTAQNGQRTLTRLETAANATKERQAA